MTLLCRTTTTRTREEKSSPEDREVACRGTSRPRPEILDAHRTIRVGGKVGTRLRSTELDRFRIRRRRRGQRWDGTGEEGKAGAASRRSGRTMPFEVGEASTDPTSGRHLLFGIVGHDIWIHGADGTSGSESPTPSFVRGGHDPFLYPSSASSQPSPRRDHPSRHPPPHNPPCPPRPSRPSRHDASRRHQLPSLQYPPSSSTPSSSS